MQRRLEELAVINAAVQGSIRLGNECRRVHRVPQDLPWARGRAEWGERAGLSAGLRTREDPT